MKEERKISLKKALLFGACFLTMLPVTALKRAEAQEKPVIHEADLSTKTLEELWKAAEGPGKAMCFVKMNPNDQLIVIVSPALGFGAITEKGRSGKLSLGFQTEPHAMATHKGNVLTISYKGDENRRSCSVSMEVTAGKISSVKADPGCSDYEDGQDHFEQDLIGATAMLSNAH